MFYPICLYAVYMMMIQPRVSSPSGNTVQRHHLVTTLQYTWDAPTHHIPLPHEAQLMHHVPAWGCLFRNPQPRVCPVNAVFVQHECCTCGAKHRRGCKCVAPGLYLGAARWLYKHPHGVVACL